MVLMFNRFLRYLVIDLFAIDSMHLLASLSLLRPVLLWTLCFGQAADQEKGEQGEHAANAHRCTSWAIAGNSEDFVGTTSGNPRKAGANEGPFQSFQQSLSVCGFKVGY